MIIEYLHDHFHLGLPGMIGVTVGGVACAMFVGVVSVGIVKGQRPVQAIANAPGGTSVLDTIDRLTDLFLLFDYLEHVFGRELFEGDAAIPVVVRMLRELDVEVDYWKGQKILEDILKRYSPAAHQFNVESGFNEWVINVAKQIISDVGITEPPAAT